MTKSAKRPTRPPDQELFGEGPFTKAGFPPANTIEFQELFRESMGDATYPRGWWAACLWLK